MAKKLCDVCGIRNAVSAAVNDGISGMCVPCYTEAGYENEHNDNGHEEILAYDSADKGSGTSEPTWFANERPMMANCWICHPELNKANASKKAHNVTGPIKQSAHRSHKGCGHALTPELRSACRAAGGPGTAVWKNGQLVTK